MSPGRFDTVGGVALIGAIGGVGDRVSFSAVRVGTLLTGRLGEESRVFGRIKSETVGWKVIVAFSTAAKECEDCCRVRGSRLLSSTTLGA